MTNNTTKTDQRKAIEDYGLVRSRMMHDDEDVSFIEPYLGPGPYGWEGFETNIPHASGEPLNMYVISLSHQAYVTSFVKLTETEEIGAKRLTEMRYRDMVVDDIRSAGGNIWEMRYVGGPTIVNEYARASIVHAFKRAGRDILAGGAVEITLDGQPDQFLECVRTNPFARGLYHLFEQSNAAEMGGAFIKRFIFLSERCESLPGYDTVDLREIPIDLHIVAEIGRKTD